MKQLLIILLSFYPMFSQAQVRVTLKSLINTQWMDTMYLPKDDNVLMFTQKGMTYDSYGICSTINIESYYLSNKPDEKFDEKKVGKVKAGRYIILEPEENKRPDYYMILKRTKNELKLKFVSGNTSYKDIKSYQYLWREPKLRHKNKPSDKLQVVIEEPVDGIYDVVEQMPQFPDGNEAMMEYLINNVKWPNMGCAVIQGRVVVSAIVEKDGSLSDFKVVRPVHPLLDQEALRVVRNMPCWQPGKQNGKEVRVRVNIPLSFKTL